MKLLVLCTESDTAPLDALRSAAIVLAPDAHVKQATSVGELLIALQNTRYELTLLPGETRSGLIDSIRRVHPGVPLARYASGAGDVPTDRLLPRVSLNRLPGDLARVLGIQHDSAPSPPAVAALLPDEPPAFVTEATPVQEPTLGMLPAADVAFDEDLVSEVLAELDLPPAVRQIVLIRDHRLQVNFRPNEPRRSDNGSAANGAPRRQTTAPLDIEAAEVLAAQVSSHFRGADLSGQVHFFQEPGTEKLVIVYTRPAPGGYLLTLVAAPETSTGLLRGTANAVAHRLSQARRRRPAGQPGATVLVDTPLPAGEPAVNPFALAWQPRKPLPAALFEPLRLAVERIAGANACHVRHLSLRPEYVQLVVSCPGGRNSAWVAHTFKRGVEREIQKQFNIPARLWADGYFARESLEPLTAAELQLFLNAPA